MRSEDGQKDCLAAKHGGSLTPHLIYPKKLSLVLAVVKQMPEVHIVKEQTVDELLSASPIMRAQHVGDCTRDIFNQRVHLHAEPGKFSASTGDTAAPWASAASRETV